MFDKGRGEKKQEQKETIKRGRKEHFNVSLVFGQPLSLGCVCIPRCPNPPAPPYVGCLLITAEPTTGCIYLEHKSE